MRRSFQVREAGQDRSGNLRRGLQGQRQEEQEQNRRSQKGYFINFIETNYYFVIFNSFIKLLLVKEEFLYETLVRRTTGLIYKKISLKICIEF